VVVGGTGAVSATGGASGNPVTFSSLTAGVCTTGGVNGATVTGVSLGTCTIAANQAGNANYTAAPQVTQSFAVTLALTGFTAGPASLYPADRRMHLVTLTPIVIGPAAPPSCTITNVTFNTPQVGAGPDVVSTGPLAVSLRAERPTTTASRVYTLTVTCSGGATFTVTVAVGLPFGRTFSALGGPDVLLVPACTTCAWTATSRAS
jgi:hypothetical protein